MHRLGGHVVGFSDAKMTRAGDFYQESIKDTVHMLEYYGDVIAMRHFQQGAPAEAARWASVPVINCGDGWGEHPTQVLTDLYTIWHEKGTLDGLTVLCVGDMRMRTMHSILYAMSQFDMEALIVWPARDVAPARSSSRAGRTERDLPRGRVGGQAHRRRRRDLHGAGRPGRLHRRAGTSGGRAAHDARRVPGDPGAAAGQARRATPSSSTRCPGWTSCRSTWTTRTSAYWVEAYNGVVMRMALLSRWCSGAVEWSEPPSAEDGGEEEWSCDSR